MPYKKYVRNMEKLEAVKQLVRANNYVNNDLTFKQCQKLGFTVNRVGLEVFARKLRAMDHASESNNASEFTKPQDHHNSGSTLTFDKSSIQLDERNDSTTSDSTANHTPVATASNVTPINSADARRQPASSDPVERKREITFELGTIKVREYELLQELNALALTDKASEATNAF